MEETTSLSSRGAGNRIEAWRLTAPTLKDEKRLTCSAVCENARFAHFILSSAAGSLDLNRTGIFHEETAFCDSACQSL